MSNLATITNNILADSGIDDINVIVSTGSYANPAWITSLAWTKITGAPSGIVTGTGTTNYLPKFTGTSTVGNSQIFDNGTSVGINTATPGGVFVLDVVSRDTTYNTRLYQPSTLNTSYNSLLISGAMTSAVAYFGIGGSATGNTSFRDSVVIGSQSSHPLVFNTADAERMEIFTDGNVSISNSPSNAGFKLDVNGTGRFSSDLTANRYRGINSLVLNSYTTVNPSSNVYLYSPPNDRDAWIYLDSADTGSNWGIYHRQIDSTVSGLPANSIGFVGGGSILQAWISLENGNGYYAGSLTASSIIRSGGTSSQYLMADGSVSTLTNPVTGTGTSGQVAYFNGTTSITSESNLFWDATNDRLGINNATPGKSLDIVTNVSQDGIRITGSSNPRLTIIDSTNNVQFDVLTTDTEAVIRTDTNHPLHFTTNGVPRMYLNTSGNLGLGVTPSAWNSSVKVIEIANTGNFIGNSGNDNWLATNTIYDSGATFRYARTGSAVAFYSQSSGGHFWFNAPIGTAGNAISLNQAMTLTLNNNLLVGTPTDNGARLQVSGTSTFSSWIRTFGDIYAASGTSTAASIRFWDANSGLYHPGSDALGFITSGTQKMVILANGNVGIGTLSPTFFSGNTTLAINNAAGGAVLELQSNGTSALRMATSSSDSALWEPRSVPVLFGTANTPRMTITSGGNVGIGVTPSAWNNSTFPNVLQVGFASLITNGGAFSQLSSNIFFDGSTYRHITTGGIGRIGFDVDGAMFFGNAASQAGGAAATFVERMRITSGGNVLIGSPPPSDSGATLRVGGHIDISSTSTSAPSIGTGIFLRVGGSASNFNGITFQGNFATDMYLGRAVGSDDLVIRSNSGSQFRFTTSGAISINSLAGSGNRIVVANSGGTLISAVIGSGLAFDGTTLTATGGGSGSISGSGTSGTVALFTGATSIGNSAITQSGSNVTFSGGINPTKTAKNTYAIQIRGSLYGAPRLQVYDLAADPNAYMGLGTDMSGAPYEFSNYFPRTGGNGRWSVGSWAGDFGAGQYVSGYNEKFFIVESAAQFNTNLGIGVSPATNLHVQGASVSYGQVRFLNSSSSGEASIHIGRTNQTVEQRWTVGQGVAGIGDSFGFYTGGSSRVNLQTNGNLLIGTVSDNGNKLRVNGTIFSDSSITATSFFESSDATLKTLIQDNYQAKGIDSVVAKLYIKNGKEELGYFAQDLQDVLPSAVSKGSDGLLNLSYREVHTAKIAYLEERIKQLEKKYENN